MKYAAEGIGGRSHSGEQCAAGATAFQKIGHGAEEQCDFSSRLACDHLSILAATGRMMLMGVVAVRL